MADDKITEIEIKNDLPPPSVEVVIDKEPKESAAKRVVTADEGVEDLKAQVARAKAESERRLSEANRQIEEARRRALAAEHEITTVKTGAVTTVIDNLTKDREAARRDYKAAMEAGDYDKAGEAQERIATAAARIVEAERGKQELEAQVRNPSQSRDAQPQFVDNVERLARSMQSRRSAEWIRAHPEHVQGDRLSPQVMSAHYNAEANGIQADTDEYFAFIERSVGHAKAGTRADDRARAPTAAPVARDVAQSPGAQRPGTVKLTSSEVATARALDMSLEDYARHKRALMEEGKIGRMAS